MDEPEELKKTDFLSWATENNLIKWHLQEIIDLDKELEERQKIELESQGIVKIYRERLRKKKQLEEEHEEYLKQFSIVDMHKKRLAKKRNLTEEEKKMLELSEIPKDI